MCVSFKPQACSIFPHETSLTEHKFIDKIIKNFKTVTAEY